MPALISKTTGVSRECLPGFARSWLAAWSPMSTAGTLLISEPLIHFTKCIAKRCSSNRVAPGRASLEQRTTLSLSLPRSYHPPNSPLSFHKEEDRKHTAGSSRICKESLRKEVTVQMSSFVAVTMPRTMPKEKVPIPPAGTSNPPSYAENESAYNTTTAKWWMEPRYVHTRLKIHFPDRFHTTVILPNLKPILSM